MKLEVRCESWPFVSPFRITDHEFSGAQVLVVSLADGEGEDRAVGRGEAAGVYYRGDTPESMTAEIESVRGVVEAGIERRDLEALMAPGGARNALDAAMWDLEAKRRGLPVWKLAGVKPPRPLRTTFTVSAGTPAQMARAAADYRGARAIKLKLTAEDPAGCVHAVRAARPDVWLGVDANQGLDRAGLETILPQLAEARVALIEQPLAVGRDGDLEGLISPIPIAADESVQTLADLRDLPGRYQVANIKLDKCGGLTEGLAMAGEARRLGLKVMVGCMSGTSLAMAPAFVLGQLCDFVDLDGPTFLTADRAPAALYERGEVWCGEEIWGGPALQPARGFGTEAMR